MVALIGNQYIEPDLSQSEALKEAKGNARILPSKIHIKNIKKTHAT
jgi:hypothetical protein